MLNIYVNFYIKKNVYRNKDGSKSNHKELVKFK